MKKIIIAIVALIVIFCVAGAGAYIYFVKMKYHHEQSVAVAPQKPIIFAQISNLVVSVPEDSTNPTNQVFIQLSVQFATVDPKAVASFNDLLPIIQSEIVSMLMEKNAAELMNPNTHAKLSLEFLNIANNVLNNQQKFNPKNPFSAAYITNIVQQD